MNWSEHQGLKSAKIGNSGLNTIGRIGFRFRYRGYRGSVILQTEQT